MPQDQLNLDTYEDHRQEKILTSIPLVLLVITLIAFRKEVFEVILSVIGLLKLAMGSEVVFSPTALNSLGTLVYIFLVSFGSVFAVFLLLLSSQALLPVRRPREIYQTARHLMYFISKMHGPALFVKDGNLRASAKDFRSAGPGVAVVDFNSAIALEELVLVPGISNTVHVKSSSIRKRNQTKPRQPLRIKGAGVVFTRSNERIRGVADLRKQFRLNARQLAEPAEKPKVSGVSAYTRDGIEVYTNVTALFTIGEDADVLQVVYENGNIGDSQALRVVTFASGANQSLLVSSLSEELDDQDRAEIHAVAQAVYHTNQMQPYSPPPLTSPKPTVEERVFRAIFSQARTMDDQELPWTDLPTRVATDFFREILAKECYNDLYQTGENSGGLKVFQLKAQLRQKMRSQSIMAYRLVFHRACEPFRIGKDIPPSHLRVSGVRPLEGSKFLRDRGIKVLFSGFGDLNPVSEAVYQQRVESWRAPWQRDIKITEAEAGWRASRQMSRARSQAQEELFYSLSQIFEKNENTDEVLAIRIFQALENAASDPSTQKWLPADSFNLLRHFHDWLLPPQKPAWMDPSLPPPRQLP